MMLRYLVFAAALLSMPAMAEVRIDAPPVVLGQTPVVRITGLAPDQEARVHLVRMFTRWVTDDPTQRSGWRQALQPLHAWADVRADRNGEVDLARFPVREGTYRGADPYGLMWSGRKTGDALLASVALPGFDVSSLRDGEMRLLVTDDTGILVQAPFMSTAPGGLIVAEIADGVLNGAFAAPNDGRRHPTVILLHGSEGGDRDGARMLAQQYAGQGFAAVALNYFAWDLKRLPGVPDAHVNQPIEILERVREWIATRPEADADRIGVYGHSKGAEFAAVAAVRLPWIRAVAACVPSDAVWEGYGIGDPRNDPEPGRTVPQKISSWSWQGTPLPYIALPSTDDRSAYFNNTAYYEARRAADPVAAHAARIPVEQSNAYFLWLGGGRDETWASGTMAARNHEALGHAGKGSRSELHIYPKAGHAICGDGTYPTRLWADDSSDARKPDLDAEAQATIDAWQRIVAFFRRTL